jgi:hypothetical protein
MTKKLVIATIGYLLGVICMAVCHDTIEKHFEEQDKKPKI